MEKVSIDKLMSPTIKALRNLGGSGHISEIYEEVIKLEKFDEETLAIPRSSTKDNRTMVEYNLAWARTYLKRAGYLENSSRGVWSLTDEGRKVGEIDSQEVVKKGKSAEFPSGLVGDSDFTPAEDSKWREDLHRVLVKGIDPDAFERLTQRMLRESGFVQVRVTGRKSDGGIGGKGILSINDFMNFHVAFQCKKYKNPVGPDKIRDFRGALDEGTDRGIFITTGRFTVDATKEANRDGVTPIELVDGEKLADKLKELALGIETKPVEYVKVKKDWFLNL